MYDVTQQPPTKKFRTAWAAAGQHLQRRGEDAINWLRADLDPPMAEHLSFRLGNRLFFVFVEVDGGIDGPSSKELFLEVAAEATALPTVLRMQASRGGFQPVDGGWGLRDMRDNSIVDPPALVSDELIEMSDWEVHDLAIQVVTSHLRPSCEVVSRQPSPHIDPQVWFKDEQGPAYVVVRSARYPHEKAPRPTHLAAIIDLCARKSQRGFFASVVVASGEQEDADPSLGALPLYRGHSMIVGFDGLEPLHDT